jgi:hypothetical protein
MAVAAPPHLINSWTCLSTRCVANHCVVAAAAATAAAWLPPVHAHVLPCLRAIAHGGVVPQAEFREHQEAERNSSALLCHADSTNYNKPPWCSPTPASTSSTTTNKDDGADCTSSSQCKGVCVGNNGGQAVGSANMGTCALSKYGSTGIAEAASWSVGRNCASHVLACLLRMRAALVPAHLTDDTLLQTFSCISCTWQRVCFYFRISNGFPRRGR